VLLTVFAFVASVVFPMELIIPVTLVLPTIATPASVSVALLGPPLIALLVVPNRVDGATILKMKI